MPRPCHTSLAVLLTSAALFGCATDRERAAWSDWNDLDATFRPINEEIAPLSSASTLSDYVALAFQRNPAIRAQSSRWKADLERVAQARALPDPQLSYGGYIQEVETRVGPQRHRLGISQRIPWPGKLANASEVALEQSEATRARAVTVRRRVIRDVAAAYADYYYLARERAVTQEVLALLRQWETVAQMRLRAGSKAAHRDAIKAQVEIGQLEDRLKTLDDDRKPKVARLRALLHLPKAFELPWPSSLPATALALPDSEVLALASRHSPLLAELASRVAARERGVDLAWKSYLPDLMFGLDYIETGQGRRNGLGLRPSGSGDDAIIAKFGLTLPIWFGRYDSQVSEAKARLRAAELDRTDAENTVDAAAVQALFNHRDALRKIRLYRDTLIPKAEQSLQANAAAFESGTGSFLDVLDSQRVLLEFHLSRERANARRVTSFADLELLTGVDLTPETQQ
mgnify:CR=1 FL=1